jgi:hypothetical protein
VKKQILFDRPADPTSQTYALSPSGSKNALFGTLYGADTPVEITTLKNVLSRGRVNDLSYILDDRLVVLI